MSVSEFVLNLRKRLIDRGLGDAVSFAAEELLLRGPLRRLDRLGYRSGTSIFDRDWDVLIVLDGCRTDLFREVLIAEVSKARSWSWGTHDSVASTSATWLRRTFGDERAYDTAYVTGNPFSASEMSASDVGHLDEVWRYAWDDEAGTIHPRPLTDRAIDTWRRRDEIGVKRLIVHYMQPHYPFVGTNIGDGLRPNDIGGDSKATSAWELLKKGEIEREDLWVAYRENLKYVLLDVDLLTSVINADRVVLSADHGNAAGEFGVYEHPAGIPIQCLREVPWVETSATVTQEYQPEDWGVNNFNDGENVEKRLRDLGYI